MSNSDESREPLTQSVRTPADNFDEALYNSRLIKNYAEYIRDPYPEIDIEPILDYAGITHHELEDQGHWFTQTQVDRFHEKLSQKAGDPHISRKVGRFAASSQASGTFRQYALGLITPASAYRMLGIFASNMTRATAFEVRKISSNKIEVTVRAKRGTKEKPYQCDNRLGLLESVGKVLTNKFAKIEHPICLHEGGVFCRYNITWEKNRFRTIRIFGGLLSLAFFVSAFALLFFLPISNWIIFALGFALVIMSIFLYSEFLEKKEQRGVIETQGNAAKDLLDEMKIRYNSALLMQEIGQATSEVLDKDRVVREVLKLMEKRLDFDRGMIMLSDKNQTRLLFSAGYGYDRRLAEVLEKTEFHLDRKDSKGIGVEAFKKQESFIVDDVNKIKGDLSDKSLEFVKITNANSFICVPIVYEKQSLGILVADNVTSKRSLTQSDMSLLKGIASQAAINIIEAMTFQKIQESEEKYRTILESIEEGYFEVDLAGRLTFFNDSICKILGYSRKELMGMGNRDYTDSETAARMYKAFNETYRTGTPANIIDYRIIRKDGGTRSLELTASLLKHSSGEPAGFRGVVRDVTERKHAEELHREKLAAEAASRAKSQFLANMSHEIRTPLNGIIGMTELAMMREMDSKHRNILQTIQTESNSLLGIINDVLDFSKIEAEMLELEEISFEPASVVDNVVNAFAHSVEQKGLEIKSALTRDVPETVVGDPGRLRQILINLVGNAVKFTQKGEISIEVHPADDLDKKVRLRFEVKDTGIGIPRDKRRTIFESFTQADSSTTRKYGGTGLGTTISKHLAELMGGEIGVESELGVGSCFWFTAIFLRQTGETVSRDLKEKEPIKASDLQGKENKSFRILLVEDYPTNQQVAVSHLKSAGHEVDSAANGLAALELFRKNHYHLILMDVQMPIMDGYEATRQIRKLEERRKQMGSAHRSSDLQSSPSLGDRGQGEFRRVPIVAMTAHAVEGYREKCLKAGMDDYLTKPLKRKHFLAVVEKWTRLGDVEEVGAAGLSPESYLGRVMPDGENPLQQSIPDLPSEAGRRTEERPPMDFERALAEFEGDRAFLTEVLKGFTNNVREQIDVIQQALDTRDAERVRREAHSIKGGAANLRADALSGIALELENIGKSGELTMGRGLLKKLEKELDGLEELEKTLQAA